MAEPYDVAARRHCVGSIALTTRWPGDPMIFLRSHVLALKATTLVKRGAWSVARKGQRIPNSQCDSRPGGGYMATWCLTRMKSTAAMDRPQQVCPSAAARA